MRAVPFAAQPRLRSASMGRSLREKIHNPFNWVCNCDPSCWCNTTQWGHAIMWYVPPRFHHLPKQ